MPPPPRALFTGLVDDAALFPPGNAPMPQAIAEHLVHRQAAYGDLVGPFVCPASKVADLLAELPDGVRVDVSLVFDVTGDDAHRALRVVASDPRLTLGGSARTAR
jgi:hypothetical protein